MGKVVPKTSKIEAKNRARITPNKQKNDPAADNCIFKVNNRNTTTVYKIC